MEMVRDVVTSCIREVGGSRLGAFLRFLVVRVRKRCADLLSLCEIPVTFTRTGWIPTPA